MGFFRTSLKAKQVISAWMAVTLIISGFFLPAKLTAAEQFSATYHKVDFLNDRARDITGATVLNIPGFAAPAGLTGDGQIIAIADSGLDIGRMDDIHPDLRSTPGKMPKVVLLKSWAGRKIPDDPNGHGTHMAATVAGTGAASNGQFKGIAPGASIYFQAILNAKGEPTPPADLSNLFTPAYSAGARIHIDGWGSGSNTYGRTAAQIDNFVRQQPDFLPVFGAGNAGPSPGTLTSEANSKNALVVGASVLPRPMLVPGAHDTRAAATFSSRGPAGDGRIKPELLAPASAVVSARSRLVESNLPGFPQYLQMQGTSMATAVAGGSAALLREYFKKEASTPSPTAALLRAALASGAREMAGGPSGEGFGIIDLTTTVLGLKDETFHWEDQRLGVKHGEESVYTYTVTDSSAPFKATLAWTDPPGRPGGKALVNDLDLIVEAPDGKTYYGNHFLRDNTPDRINNIEQVYLPSPAPGKYTVRAAARAVQQNTVRGSSRPTQDFALVWGQPPQRDKLAASDGNELQLASGGKVASSTTTAASGTPTLNAIDDLLYKVDAAHLFPGAAVYRTPKALYLTVRLWRATGVGALHVSEGTIFGEINRAARLGGYTLEQQGEVFLNGRSLDAKDLPQGVEVSASINPADQTARRVDAAFTERAGFATGVRSQNDREVIGLLRDRNIYTISPDAAYSFEDTIVAAEPKDMPFGTGTLAGSVQVLPGMAVHLHLAPSTGEVQYLAVKRQVVLGTVKEVNTNRSEVRTETGYTLRVFPGALFRRDGKDVSSLSEIRTGDHVMAMLLPDTGQAIGIVAYSNVIYGKVIDYSSKTRTLYLVDDSFQYRSFTLPTEAVIYRWGVQTSAEALAAGSRVRLTTDAAAARAMRLDITETFYAPGKVYSGYYQEKGIVYVNDGTSYRADRSSRFYKNGHPVIPEAILPGDRINIEYVLGPPPTGPVLVSVEATSSASQPFLQASTVVLSGRLVVTGESGTSDVYIFDEKSSSGIPVDASGRFTYELPLSAGGKSLRLVAVDRNSGGVAGQPVLNYVAGNGSSNTTGRDLVSKAMSLVAPASTSKLVEKIPITRGAAAVALAGLLHWPETSGYKLPFVDVYEIPAAARPAAAEAQVRRIINGYPDGSFRPNSFLTRAQVAVILASTLRHIGIKLPEANSGVYTDADKIPAWAVTAVSELTGAGIFKGRPGGIFAPGDPITAGDMASLLDRTLAYLEKKWPKSSA